MINKLQSSMKLNKDEKEIENENEKEDESAL